MAILSYDPSMRSQVLDIWLLGNLQAHPFVAPAYWRERREEVGDALSAAQVLVEKEKEEILGFAGVTGQGYIAGIFVAPESRGKGVGTRLLDACKERFCVLRLHVYEKNRRAASFYQKNGFLYAGRGADPGTGLEEIAMEWRRMGEEAPQEARGAEKGRFR